MSHDFPALLITSANADKRDQLHRLWPSTDLDLQGIRNFVGHPFVLRERDERNLPPIIHNLKNIFSRHVPTHFCVQVPETAAGISLMVVGGRKEDKKEVPGFPPHCS